MSIDKRIKILLSAGHYKIILPTILLFILAGFILPNPVDVVMLNAKIVKHEGSIYIGTPFKAMVEFDTKQCQIEPMKLPLRFGNVTLRALSLLRLAGKTRLIMELQIFDRKSASGLSIVLRCRSQSSSNKKLVIVLPEIPLKSLLKGDGPFYPKPPRAGFASYEPDYTIILVLGFVIFILTTGFFIWIRRKAKVASTPDIVELSSVGNNYFVDSLSSIWSKRASYKRVKDLINAMVEVFRDFISWRFKVDAHPLTTNEIISFLRSDPQWHRMADSVAAILGYADQCRFSSKQGNTVEIYRLMSKAIVELGNREEFESDHFQES